MEVLEALLVAVMSCVMAFLMIYIISVYEVLFLCCFRYMTERWMEILETELVAVMSGVMAFLIHIFYQCL